MPLVTLGYHLHVRSADLKVAHVFFSPLSGGLSFLPSRQMTKSPPFCSNLDPSGRTPFLERTILLDAKFIHWFTPPKSPGCFPHTNTILFSLVAKLSILKSIFVDFILRNRRVLSSYMFFCVDPVMEGRSGAELRRS